MWLERGIGVVLTRLQVVTLKNLDQRLLKMRAVSDRAQEYRALMTHFAEQLGSHVVGVLTDRAALRPPQVGSQAPQPFHMHITPFIKLFECLPRSVTAQLLDSYMDLAKQVYKSDLPAYFGSLLSAVRRSKELTILEAFHLALQAVWGLVQAELEFWSKLLESSVAGDEAATNISGEVNPQLANRLGEVFAEQGEELGALVELRALSCFVLQIVHVFFQKKKRYADRHATLDVIGMVVEANGWRSSGEPMQSLSAVVAISTRLTSMAQRYLQKVIVRFCCSFVRFFPPFCCFGFSDSGIQGH